MSTLLIKNGILIRMTSRNDELKKSDILIKDKTIVEISTKIDSENVDRVIDANGKVVMPGFINCHNHAAMSLFRGYSDDLRLMDWIYKKILPAEEKLNGDDIYWGTMLATLEMIKSGTTTFADMYINMEYVANAVQDSGMRASLCRGATFVDDEDIDSKLNDIKDFICKWDGKADNRISTMLGPHAPYTVPPPAMKGIIEIAQKLEKPIHIHLAETTEEVEQIFLQYKKSPTQYLNDLGFFNNTHVLLAHSVHISREDLTLLKGIKGGVSHNPVSNQKLGCGIAPIIEMREMGIHIGIGTDGAGSATTLDMFEEIKSTAWLQKNRYFDPTILSAYCVLKMATIEGAKVLGLDKYIGSLEVGKLADIILVDINKPHLYPHNDIMALLAYSANGADIDTVLVNGEVLLENRNFTKVQELQIFDNVNKITKRIFS